MNIFDDFDVTITMEEVYTENGTMLSVISDDNFEEFQIFQFLY